MKDNWRDGNTVKLLINGEEFFPRVFDSINNAREEVLIETFILYEDEVGYQLQKALIAAAKRGVRVEITVDDYGTWDLSQPFVSAMAEAGVKLHIFDPKPKLWGVRLNLFRRLHRKLVVVDRGLAFVGGINYSADHLISFGPTAKQDYAVEVRGPIVADIHHTCMLLLQRGSSRKDKRAYARSTKPPLPKAEGNVRMLLAERDNGKHTKDIERHYLLATRLAKKRLVIANAYFFPGYRLLRGLRRAAQRGVKVTLILQGQPDMAWVTALSRLLYNYLIRSGVTIHEYCQRPLHGKVALMDDEWATVGSSNLDPLSLALNLEANLVIQDAAFNQQLYEHLEGLANSHCTPVDMDVAQRGYWWRIPLVFLSFHFLRHFPALLGWLPAHAPELKLITPRKQAWGRKSFNADDAAIDKIEAEPTRPSKKSAYDKESVS